MPEVHRKLQPIPFTDISFQDDFWSPRIKVNRDVTIPHIYDQCQATGRISAFTLDFQRSLPAPIVLIFGDSDIAKWVEAASFSLADFPDENLQAKVDDVIEKIIHAQQPDGYLNTHFIKGDPAMRWKNLRDWHEMYCAGHLIEAAVAHFHATGSHVMLDALTRYADHIDATFGPEPGKRPGYCGHPEIELALVKLYHATNNPRYLQMATYMVEERGAQPHYYDWEARQRGDDPAKYWAKTYDYCQAHLPVREQTKVVGHAVRAMYLLSAVADLAHEKNDLSLLVTCQRLWENLVSKRMYLTGAIGPSAHNEGFTQDYDLPDETAYAETCATIGVMMWNHRLLQFNGESKYADVIERALYNGFLSSISLTGDQFFYENPLASFGENRRQTWFDCPCCPPNIARTFASLGQYFYSSNADGVWVHQFAQGTAHFDLGGVPIQLRQQTDYPWNGNVRIEIGVDRVTEFGVHIRVPGWCRQWSVKINNLQLDIQPDANGYLVINRDWSPGDCIFYAMEMPIELTWANPAVRALQGRVAFQRGPLVYCLEAADHQDIPLETIALDGRSLTPDVFEAVHEPNLLGGLTIIQGYALALAQEDGADRLYQNAIPKGKKIKITALPYYAWANRNPGAMRVWLPVY
jgi:DUF1680 family protein